MYDVPAIAWFISGRATARAALPPPTTPRTPAAPASHPPAMSPAVAHAPPAEKRFVVPLSMRTSMVYGADARCGVQDAPASRALVQHVLVRRNGMRR